MLTDTAQYLAWDLIYMYVVLTLLQSYNKQVIHNPWNCSGEIQDETLDPCK